MIHNLEVSSGGTYWDAGERWFRHAGSEPVFLRDDLQARYCSDPAARSVVKTPLSLKVIVCVKFRAVSVTRNSARIRLITGALCRRFPKQIKLSHQGWPSPKRHHIYRPTVRHLVEMLICRRKYFTRCVLCEEIDGVRTHWCCQIVIINASGIGYDWELLLLNGVFGLNRPIARFCGPARLKRVCF